MDIERLIKEIERRPPIWDSSDPRHCNRDMVSMAWHEISQILKLEADTLRKRWKSLRDNFRVELKKVPAGKQDDAALPIDQYLSKWPYFKMLFFLRDPMLGRKNSYNVTKTSAPQEAHREACSPVPAMQCEDSEYQSQEPLSFRNLTETDISPGFQLISLERPNKRKIYDSQMNNANLIQMEREKLEVKRQKVQLLIEDRRRREREENNSDRHFLLSLLPILRQVPENKRLLAQIRLQEALQDVLLQEGESNERYTQVTKWTLQ